MARWAPEETDTMAALAREIVQGMGTNRTVIAVDGQRGVDLERVAASLVSAFEQQEIPALAARAGTTDPDSLRAEIVDPFRTTGFGDGVLVAHGHGLLGTGARSLWRWTLWVEDGRTDEGDDGRSHASAVLDVADPDHPRRDWADAC